MKIKLLIGNEEKTFTAPFVSARKLKETFSLSNKVQNGFDETIMDEIATYLVNIYGNQFTMDELYDGYPAHEIFNKAMEDIETVIVDFGDKVKN